MKCTPWGRLEGRASTTLLPRAEVTFLRGDARGNYERRAVHREETELKGTESLRLETGGVLKEQTVITDVREAEHGHPQGKSFSITNWDGNRVGVWGGGGGWLCFGCGVVGYGSAREGTYRRERRSKVGCLHLSLDEKPSKLT